MSPLPAWDQLRNVWPKVLATPGEDVAEFLREVPTRKNPEHGFARRLPWFGFLGSATDEEVRRRQAFFFGYANLWTTTNAYVRAGAQAFAPVLQNTRTEELLGKALQWASGATPVKTGFMTLGRDDDDTEPQDRSEYAAVVEVYGFLNLDLAPFYNNRAEIYRRWFEIPESLNAYDLTQRVGDETAAWLTRTPGMVTHLAELFRRISDQPLKTRVELESIESPKAKKFAEGELLDEQLLRDLNSAAFITLQIVDAVRNCFPALRRGGGDHEIVHADPLGRLRRAPRPPAILEVADQLLLLRVDRGRAPVATPTPADDLGTSLKLDIQGVVRRSAPAPVPPSDFAPCQFALSQDASGLAQVEDTDHEKDSPDNQENLRAERFGGQSSLYGSESPLPMLSGRSANDLTDRWPG